MRSLIPPLAEMSFSNRTLSVQTFCDTVDDQLRDYQIMTIRSLSQLELALLIAALKYMEDVNVFTANFEVVYNEYHRFASIHNVAQKKSIALMVSN